MDVDLGEEGTKPMRQQCAHLIHAVIQDGVFVQAGCDRHDDRPFDCATFEPSDGPCELGIRRWRRRKAAHPEAALPGSIKHIVENSG